MRKATFEELREEIKQIKKEYPKLSEPDAFVFWFYRVFIVDSDDEAENATAYNGKEKGIDGIHIDNRAKLIHVVQGKYHNSEGKFGEKSADIEAFAHLANHFSQRDNEKLKLFLSGMQNEIREKFDRAHRLIVDEGWNLRLYFVTTGSITEIVKNTAKTIVEDAPGDTQIFFFDFDGVMLAFTEYLHGFAPSVTSLQITVGDTKEVTGGISIHREDKTALKDTDVESWVFSVTIGEIARIFRETGQRIFARNIRGFLGTNKVNKAISDTLQKKPQLMWYFNNGITLVCTHVEKKVAGNKEVINVIKPQIINGQQTTRAIEQIISGLPEENKNASVLLRVISIPTGNEGDYDNVISSIVRSTNSQSSIKPSDLVSNDYMQVYLWRELRKIDYWYARKEMNRGEELIMAGKRIRFHIKKQELAQAVAATHADIGPAGMSSTQQLFEEENYRKIFSSKDIYDYLTPYWTMRIVGDSSYGGDSTRAKWFVLNHHWKFIKDKLNHVEDRIKYVKASESYYTRGKTETDVLGAFKRLRRGLEQLYHAALEYHSVSTKNEPKDIRSFLKDIKRIRGFTTYLEGDGKKRYASYKTAVTKFFSWFDGKELV